jgi:hypothetical protein
MARFDGTLARQFDFGPVTTTSTAVRGGVRGRLRLAGPAGTLRGPDKYRVLEHRRRQAQIAARRLLDVIEEGGLDG